MIGTTNIFIILFYIISYYRILPIVNIVSGCVNGKKKRVWPGVYICFSSIFLKLYNAPSTQLGDAI